MGYTPGTVLDGMRVDLGGVQLGMVDAAGVAWRIGADGLQGWDGSDVRYQSSEREADHGAWTGPVYLGARPITLAGSLAAPSAAALDTAIEQLLAACALGDTTLTVWETVPKQATVRRSGKPVIKRETDTVATWSLLVTAADPRRYSTVLQSQTTALPSVSGGLVLPATLPWTLSASSVTGAIAALNEGSIATRPVIAVAGPVSQPTVSALYPDGSVRTLAYSQSLLTGDVLVIDTDAKSVAQGGATRRRWMSGPWPDIPARSSVLFRFGAAAYDPSATLTVTWRSAWL